MSVHSDPAFYYESQENKNASQLLCCKAFFINTNKGDGRNFSRSNKGVYVCSDQLHALNITCIQNG